ncbi:MAG: hypothetical protein JSS71_12695 [Armatimonadetes bacterium]|nr:hypothetical protein [Armatimonadota bacterium]MBX3110184.1 hypothetical protein [Fimbriimonadaceae bacterium]
MRPARPAQVISFCSMDDFEFARPELAATLITMEFGNDGRIHQLWATDPALPDEGEDFQFVLPPLQFGEEGADDYYPGTILLSVRTNPDEHWVSSRLSGARLKNPQSIEESQDAALEFEYEFPFLESLEVTGKYWEDPSVIPQVVWDIEIKNTGRRTVEIGELGLPFALNNYFDGFGWNDEQLTRLWQSRVYIHKFIGGGASWLFAQRMTAQSPGLIAFPGEKTGWEFFNHVRGSLNTPHQWEGIPIVYVYSKATIEREEWPTWFNEHTSLILEPGDTRVVQTRFVASESDKFDGVHHTLAACSRPTIRVLPSAVAPIDVGIGVEVQGTAVSKFYVSREATTEVDVDENGGFCFVKPAESGPMIVSFQNSEGVMCHAHLMFTDPVEQLIKRRADWIVRNQVMEAPGDMAHAIVPAEIGAIDERPMKVTDPADYEEPSGLECSLGDALFLAEKNAVYPVASEVTILDNYVERFLLSRVQNPANGAVASILVGGVPAYFGRPMTYPSVANIYHAMAKVASNYGQTSRTPTEYLKLAAQTVDALFKHGWRLYVRSVGVLGFARFYDLAEDLELHGLAAEADTVRHWIEFKSGELIDLKYPFAGETVMDTSGFEEVAAAARFQDDDDHLERTVRCAFATRSLAPSWWWYGSDKRYGDYGESTSLKAVLDRGELCLGHTTIPNSMIFFGMMDRDYLALPDAYVRLAFGGMMGPWALIRGDGAASMCYCPDLSSKHAGYNHFTGAGGLGYAHYLIGAASYVLPNRTQDGYSFGCHHMMDSDVHIVRPWDGVGRRIVMRQIGAEFVADFGVIRELRLDARLRWFEMVIENPSDKPASTHLVVAGLWGRRIRVGTDELEGEDGRFRIPLQLAAGRRTQIRGQVI